MIIFFDWETRSMHDIKHGSYAYAADPTTAAMCAHLLTEDNQHCFWTPEAVPGWSPPEGVSHAWGRAWLAELFARPDITWVAHNAQFDRCIAEITMGLPPARWVDSMIICDYIGFPGGLDAVGQHLWGVGKNAAGARLIQKLCKPQRGRWVPITRSDLTLLAQYNRDDAVLMKRLWDEYANLLPPSEMPVFFAHQAINHRGVQFDHEWARSLLMLNEQFVLRAAAAATQACNGEVQLEDLTRVEALRQWVNTKGAPLGWSIEALDEDTLTPMLHAPDVIVPQQVKLVLEARLAISRASLKKLGSALNAMSPDGRLRGQYRMDGAHTHRWTGVGVQLQNLAKPHPAFSSDNPEVWKKTGEKNPFHSRVLIDRARDACMRTDLAAFLQVVADAQTAAQRISPGMTVSVNDAFTSMVRPMFIPAPGKVLVGADYSAIEGRGAAWIAGEESELAAYRAYDAGTGPDLYCVMASIIFGRKITKADTVERQVGKVAVLGCGYGMGHAKFGATNAAALKAAGVSAEEVVKAWRGSHPRICKFWRKIEACMRVCVGGGQEKEGPFVIEQTNELSPWMTVTFPTGRKMFYHGMRMEAEKKGHTSDYGGYDDPEPMKLTYDQHRKSDGYAPGVRRTWGGSLLENLNQSLCRDLQAEALVDAEAAGLPVVIHTHDEVNTEVWADQAKDACEWLQQRMSKTPDWAPGFPVKASPNVMTRYSK